MTNFVQKCFQFFSKNDEVLTDYRPHNSALLACFGVLLTFFIFFPVMAFADGTSSGGFSKVIDNIANQFIANSTMGFISVISYVVGCAFGFMGLRKLAASLEDPKQKAHEGIIMLLVAGALCVLPFVINTILDTLYSGVSMTGDYTTSLLQIKDTAGGKTGLDTMFIKFVQAITPSLNRLAVAIAVLGGIVFIFIGTMRLVKISQQGPQAPLGFGTIMTFIVGGILIASPTMMNLMWETLDIKNAQDYVLTVGSGSGKYAEMMSKAFTAAMVFVQGIGWVAFIRGWFLLRKFSESGGKDSLVVPSVFIIGGAMAANIGKIITLVRVTIGLA